MNGIIASVLKAKVLRKIIGTDVVLVTLGIYSTGSDNNDQKWSVIIRQSVDLAQAILLCYE